MTIADANLRALIQRLSAFERRALRRYLEGVGDNEGKRVFQDIKRDLKAKARSKPEPRLKWLE